MAKSKKSKSEGKSRRRLNPEQAERLRRVGMHVLGAVLFLGGIAGGLYFTRQYVERELVFPSKPPKVVLKTRPVWMNDYVAARIAESIRPSGVHSTFDLQMLADRVKLLKTDPWIRRVRQVRRVYGEKPGDTVEVDCDYRAPIALVRWGEDYWYVDADGVKLPERFKLAELPKVVVGTDRRTHLRVVEGVRRPPPRAGLRWGGEDLQAGIEMARLLYAKPWADEIIKVDLRNFGGRFDPKEAHVVLGTKYGTDIRWGRPYDLTDRSVTDFIEVRVERKLDYLSRVFAEFGRVDARQPWIDIRFDKITYPSPEPVETQANLRR